MLKTSGNTALKHLSTDSEKQEKIKDINFIKISTWDPDKKSQNRIKNTKYNVFTFLPLIFYDQIRESSSFIFFIIMLLQSSETLAIGSFAGSVAPFLLVLIMSLAKEGIDDYKRFIRDKEVNMEIYKKYYINQKPQQKKTTIMPFQISKTHTLSPIKKVCKNNFSKEFLSFPSINSIDIQESFIDIASEDIKVGDIIFVKKGQRFPADCILLHCNDENGELFIRTDQLDGETDWKRRQCCIEIKDINDNIIAIVEQPHKDIYTFSGRLEQKIDDNNLLQIPINLDNTAWADTVAATSDCIGLVIYTGFQTRAKLNTYLPRSKSGLIDKEINKFVTILIFVVSICAISFSGMRITSFDFSAIIIFLRFVMLFSFMIPISLKVTIDLGRMAYIQYANKNITIRNTAIQEELGRISFFLTDKTGTLTQNEMLMKKLHLGTNCYDEKDFEELKEILKKFMIKRKIQKNIKNIGQKVFDLLEAISLCHNVTPVESIEGIVLQASSPDEIALVEFVQTLGIELVYRDKQVLKISYDLTKITKNAEINKNIMHGLEEIEKDIQNNKIVMEYHIHHIFPFNSDTKRMGIILERNDGSYVFFEKGADVIMKKIVKENDWAEEETDDMARDGLRTLLIGKKELTKEQFHKFDKEYTQAKLTLNNKQLIMLEVQKKLEKGLDLLGLTGVEDKLQEHVKETLESLRAAGIKIWMLTGDKIETAISIAKSSKLLGKHDRYLIISDCKTEIEIRDKIECLKSHKYTSLVIDGVSLSVILDNTRHIKDKKNIMRSRNYLLEAFIEQTKELSSLIGCRYTPTQKAMMAAALKDIAKETVLCIGDGGNDVSMITEADTGIGIEGKEGNQAALSADFSLKKFCYVLDLLFVHGRGCYVKTSNLAKITLQRSFIITIIQAVFCALINCVPLSLFQGNMCALFIVLTCIPIITLYKGSDIKTEVALTYPELYKELRMNNLCSIKELVIAILIAYIQATIISIGYMALLEKSELHFYSVVVFISAVLNEYFTILLVNNTFPRKSTIITIIFSVILFIIISHIFEEFHIGSNHLRSFAPQIFKINIAAATINIIWKAYHKYLNPASHIKITKYKKEDF